MHADDTPTLSSADAVETIAAPPRLVVEIPRAGRLRPRASRLLDWGTKGSLALTDQGLTSGAGFGVNLLLARWMPAEVYGAFAVAFAGFLFIAGFHNVLLLEPLTVFGPSRYAERLPAYFRAQFIVHAILVGALAGIALLTGLVLLRLSPGTSLSGAVVGAGLALPFLLLLWLARRMCYVMQRPSIAVAGSTFYLAIIFAGLFLLRHFGWLGSFTAYLPMASGSVLAGGLLLWRLGLLKSELKPEPGISWRGVLGENWTYGRWLVGSTVLFSLSTQAQTFLAAGLLGLGAAGILRAVQIPSLVMIQVSTAASFLVLPSFSYDFGKGAREGLRRKATLVSLSLVAGALCFAGLLALLAGRTEHLLFGGKYAGYAWLIAVFALIPVCAAFSMGYSMALRASQKPHFDLIANAVAAPVGVVSAACFMRWWGLTGAAASMIFATATSSLVVACVFWASLARRNSPLTEQDMPKVERLK